MSSKQACLIAFCALSCLYMTAAGAEKLYQWVDKDGHVHYSQTPPPSAVTNSKLVDIHVSTPIQTAAPAAPQPGQAQGQPQQQPAVQAPPPPDPATAEKQRQCLGMRAQMSAYRHSDAPMTAERKQAMADLSAQIAKECP